MQFCLSKMHFCLGENSLNGLGADHRGNQGPGRRDWGKVTAGCCHTWPGHGREAVRIHGLETWRLDTCTGNTEDGWWESGARQSSPRFLWITLGTADHRGVSMLDLSKPAETQSGISSFISSGEDLSSTVMISYLHFNGRFTASPPLMVFTRHRQGHDFISE